jgi:hypothetical protein
MSKTSKVPKEAKINAVSNASWNETPDFYRSTAGNAYAERLDGNKRVFKDFARLYQIEEFDVIALAPTGIESVHITSVRRNHNLRSEIPLVDIWFKTNFGGSVFGSIGGDDYFTEAGSSAGQVLNAVVYPDYYTFDIYNYGLADLTYTIRALVYEISAK